jgi:hypothetical protein
MRQSQDRRGAEIHDAVRLASLEVEAAWRAEFKRIGETEVRNALNNFTPEFIP